MAKSQRFSERREVGCRATRLICHLPQNTNYQDVQVAGAAKQDPILLHEAESWLPMLVFLMVTQKTNTTKSTIKAYSTSPWPSSSTMSFFKSCIYSPPLLWGGNAREVPGKRGTLLFRLLTRKHQNNFAAAGKNTLIIWRQIQKGIVGSIGLCSCRTIRVRLPSMHLYRPSVRVLKWWIRTTSSS